MKYIMLAGEYLVGAFICFLTLFTILIGLVISLFELPRYFRLTKK
jgi:hypothetical protein